jgi:hypothetical protein
MYDKEISVFRAVHEYRCSRDFEPDRFDTRNHCSNRSLLPVDITTQSDLRPTEIEIEEVSMEVFTD